MFERHFEGLFGNLENKRKKKREKVNIERKVDLLLSPKTRETLENLFPAFSRLLKWEKLYPPLCRFRSLSSFTPPHPSTYSSNESFDCEFQLNL